MRATHTWSGAKQRGKDGHADSHVVGHCRQQRVDAAERVRETGAVGAPRRQPRERNAQQHEQQLGRHDGEYHIPVNAVKAEVRDRIE